MEFLDLQEYIDERHLTSEEEQGIIDLCYDATYWRRVWILQEFVLARDYVVLCNRMFVRKECFEQALSIIQCCSTLCGILERGQGRIVTTMELPVGDMIDFKGSKYF